MMQLYNITHRARVKSLINRENVSSSIRNNASSSRVVREMSQSVVRIYCIYIYIVGGERRGKSVAWELKAKGVDDKLLRFCASLAF